jgi:hypothetical protein
LLCAQRSDQRTAAAAIIFLGSSLGELAWERCWRRRVRRNQIHVETATNEVRKLSRESSAVDVLIR